MTVTVMTMTKNKVQNQSLKYFDIFFMFWWPYFGFQKKPRSSFIKAATYNVLEKKTNFSQASLFIFGRSSYFISLQQEIKCYYLQSLPLPMYHGQDQALYVYLDAQGAYLRNT